MNVDPARSKRTSAALSPSSSFKRFKSEYCDTKLDCYTPAPLPFTATQGVERIHLPASVNVNCLSSQLLEQLARERTEILRGQGRCVVGLPVVLEDGIVLNSVRHDTTWYAERRNEELRLPVISIGGGSGTSAADVIIIDDEDDIVSCSASGLQLLESKVEDDTEAPYQSPLPLAGELSPLELSDISSNPLPSIALEREEDAAAPRGIRSDGADVTTSNSEADGADKAADSAEDIDGSGTPVRHEPSSLPSLQPIRKLLAGRRRRGGPARDVLPEGILVAQGVSRKRGRRAAFEEAPVITSSESDEEYDCRASDPLLKRVPLPKTEHGRARRLLIPDSADLPLVAVTMRGDCHFIDRKEKFRITGYSLPNPGVYRHVDDVCMVGDTAVLGCDKGTHQISFLSVEGEPQMIDVTRCPHSSGPRYQDMQKRGVSRLAAIHAEGGHIKFLSGGYDGTIHEWTADVETLNEPHSRKVVSHGSCVMALAYREQDRSVIGSVQKKLHITDLNRCKTMTHPFSNEIRHIHIHPQAAYVTLLEVRHLDRQVQLYDKRKRDFDREPCLSFGRRNASGKFSRAYTRGSVHLVHFARASEDGNVLLWDFRNTKRAVVERQFEQTEEVVHTVFAGTDVATFAKGVVTFFEDYLLDDVR